MNQFRTFAILVLSVSVLLQGVDSAVIPAMDETSKSQGKPNIVLMVSDDAGYAEFSMHGSKAFSTPRIDGIAKAGIRFTQGYTSGCVCSPTRAGLLTGRYQQHFGHEFNFPPSDSETNGLPLSETTLPSILKDAGYRTIALGKWHLGYAPKFHPMERGFTDFYGFLQGSRSYFPLPRPNSMNGLRLDRELLKEEKFDYMTDHLADKAAEYISRHKDTPFFLYLAFNATHGPIETTEADRVASGGNKIRAMTVALDRAVGKVLDSLKTNGVLDNTLVLFINDNGGAVRHDNSPLRGHKGSTLEGGIRVPFAMQWPASIPAGKTNDAPVISLDIFPTVLAAAGINRKLGPPVDGVNLLPWASGKSKDRPHETLYWKNGAAWAVRHRDLKLVAGNKVQKGSSPELFDLANDPSESRNLAEEKPEEVKKLQALHETWATLVKPTPWAPKRNKDQNSDDELKEPGTK